jgi:signal transduction histidine kinase
VFEPFFTTKRDGIGLGLSIARTIIERAGGAISAENKPAGGAVFRFTLPLATARADKSAAPGRGAEQTAGGAVETAELPA